MVVVVSLEERNESSLQALKYQKISAALMQSVVSLQEMEGSGEVEQRRFGVGGFRVHCLGPAGGCLGLFKDEGAGHGDEAGVDSKGEEDGDVSRWGVLCGI